jgi:hypothetical protein
MDEMDLVRQGLDVTPWRPEAYERARAQLRGAMTQSAPSPEATAAPAAIVLQGRGVAAGRNRRRGILGTKGKIGIGAGVAAVAAAAAVMLATTPAPRSAAPASTVAQAPAPTSKLVTLAALIKSSNDSPLPGDASLVISKQVNGGKLMQVLYALYTDDGKMYTGDDRQTLMAAVAGNANQADGTNAREIAAARDAATGNLAAARVKMINALPNCYAVGLSGSAQKKAQAACWAAGAASRSQLMKEKGIKTPLKQPTGQALQDDINSTLWTAATIGLNWGGGDPQIREGVLRLLSTIPQVTVANSTTGGQPTLTITAGPALFGDGSDQVLTVSARTGIPVSSVESGGGLATAVETNRVSRVSLASIKAGKF